MPPPSSTSISPDTQTIPVPNNLTSSPSSTLPRPTQRALLLHLQTDPNTIPQLDDILTTSLASTGWPDRVRALALELLRSGTCTTFPELQAEVLRRAKIPPPAPVPNGIATATASGKDEGKLSANGNAAQMKKGSATLSNGTTTHAPATVPQAGLGQDGLPDVRIPLKTVEEGVEFLKARVRDVVEVVEPEALEEGGSSDEE